MTPLPFYEEHLSAKMFGIRTPTKRPTHDYKSPQEPDSDRNVRRSIGEWEAVNPDNTPVMTQSGSSKGGPITKPDESKPTTAPKTTAIISVSPKKRFPNRTAEARACLLKAKEHLRNSRNLKTEIKEGVTEAINRLYELVKEAEGEPKGPTKQEKARTPKEPEATAKTPDARTAPAPSTPDSDRLLTTLAEHTQLLLENTKAMKELKRQIEMQQEATDRTSPLTYAEAAAPHRSNRDTLHSVIVTSKDETETGEDVLNRVRKAVDAKEGWVKVERVRKARDRKIIMGFGTREERDKVKTRLETANGNLIVEEAKNKDPLLVLRSVLAVNTDEDIIRALRNQNRSIFHGLDGEDDRVVIKYRRGARNPHTTNVVIGTSPKIWRRAIDAGSLHIDLQRVRVEDQSPLVQCTRCLGYGHSKRFCKEPADACSHCGEPHLRTSCPDWQAGLPPKCRNCSKNGLEGAEHNSFSAECPIKQKWDNIARSAVAYC